jgi:pilus assembly protein CpaF
MHVSRGRDGRRRLSEIAVLRRDPDGLVHAVTAWRADRGFDAGAELLRTLIAARRCT